MPFLIISNNILIIVTIYEVSLSGRESPTETVSPADLYRRLSDDKDHIVGTLLSKVLSLDMLHFPNHKILELDYVKR